MTRKKERKKKVQREKEKKEMKKKLVFNEPRVFFCSNHEILLPKFCACHFNNFCVSGVKVTKNKATHTYTRPHKKNTVVYACSKTGYLCPLVVMQLTIKISSFHCSWSHAMWIIWISNTEKGKNVFCVSLYKQGPLFSISLFVNFLV